MMARLLKNRNYMDRVKLMATLLKKRNYVGKVGAIARPYTNKKVVRGKK